MPQGNNKPLFSVIVPAYNVEQYIAQCIESVLSQDYQDFELILVDDGSTDDTGKVCDRYQKTISKVEVIHQPNAGLSAARNTGIKKASGEYLIFLDGDDYLEKNALTAIQKNLEPNLDLLRYQAQEVFADNQMIRHAEAGFATTSGVKAFKNLARSHYTENAWLYTYRRAFFEEQHFWYAEGCLAEDLGLTPLIIASARTVKAIPDICYNYRQRVGSIMHDDARIAQRIADIMQQYQSLLPKIASLPHTAPILHYLIVSFLTSAAKLDYRNFSRIYQQARQAGMLRYIHPSRPKAVPRAFLLRYSPRIFYWLYHPKEASHRERSQQ